MNMNWLDWGILIAAVVALRFVSVSTRNHMKGVADFLSANRLAGRYLLTIAGQMSNSAAIGFIALCEVYYTAGLPPIWWGLMGLLVPAIITLSGWVYWRFRETRAMTMAQFFEMRYSRRFRIFAGILAWVCGIVNFGIFPAVAARFFIYFCGLPDSFHIPGVPIAIPMFPVVMAVDLSLALMFVIMGGQIAVMVTECVQGIFSSIAFMVIIAAVLLQVGWPHIVEALRSAPAESSMLHPYHTSQVKDFNIWFYLINIFGAFYGYMSWHGTQSFNSSGRTPHEQRMGSVIGFWRQIPTNLFCLILPLAAFAVMKLPDFADKAAAINDTVKNIPGDYVGSQMRVPVALAHFLPIGIKGLMATVILFFSFTCHDTYMHSWGSIFVQDIILPLRKTPMSPGQHIRYLRWSIAFVALFSFFFGLLYPQTMPILMFFAITGTIYCAGAGSAIVFGLYWKRGTTLAAYAAMILGAVLGVFGLFANNIWQQLYGHEFPINGQYLWFVAMLGAIVTYVLISLLFGQKDKDANLPKILHRGKYSIEGEQPPVRRTLGKKLIEFVGIQKEYTFTDSILAIVMVVWTIAWFGVFLIVTTIHFTIHPTSTEWWIKFWHFYIVMQFVIGIPATIWFTVGGIVDIRDLFRRLATAVRDDKDDGRVEQEPEVETVAKPALNPKEPTEGEA
jgi:solute:Na+ symporter, SSS family